MYTLQQCETLWAEAGRHGTPDERIARTRLWEPYYSYLAQFAEPAAEPAFVARMAKEGVLTPDTTVLDIGAGTGSFALPFAKHCKEVVALEPVGACLDVLKAHARQQSLANIRTVHGFWEEFQPSEQFDVTFSSMCPAICNVEELKKMEAMTRKACCLVAVERGSSDPHRRAMMQQLGIKPRGGMVTEAIHYINALYLMGRQPSIFFTRQQQTTRISAQRVLEQYPIYFSIFGIPEQTSRAFLQDYLRKNAPDGFLTEESCLRQALILWNVESL